MSEDLAARVDWDKAGGLVPAIVQHAGTGAVLMLGYMNREALDRTLDTRKVTFFSRSRQRLWVKGETSGHTIALEDVTADCDRDALLVRGYPAGPVCHTGATTCFEEVGASPGGSGGFLQTLEKIIHGRITSGAEDSYTAKLAAAGVGRLAQKVGEEGLEVALAAVSRDRPSLVAESADLVFHLLVLLAERGLALADIERELAARHESAITLRR